MPLSEDNVGIYHRVNLWGGVEDEAAEGPSMVKDPNVQTDTVES